MICDEHDAWSSSSDLGPPCTTPLSWSVFIWTRYRLIMSYGYGVAAIFEWLGPLLRLYDFPCSQDTSLAFRFVRYGWEEVDRVVRSFWGVSGPRVLIVLIQVRRSGEFYRSPGWVGEGGGGQRRRRGAATERPRHDRLCTITVTIARQP